MASHSPFRWLPVATVLALIGLTIAVLTVTGLGRLLIISALLAYVLHPVASSLESLGLNRAAATALIFTVVALLMVALATKPYRLAVTPLKPTPSSGAPRNSFRQNSLLWD
jgi:predicted PurR-regulated permease PerM